MSEEEINRILNLFQEDKDNLHLFKSNFPLDNTMITQVEREESIRIIPMNLSKEDLIKFFSAEKKKYKPYEIIRINAVYIAGLLEDLDNLIFRIEWCHRLLNEKQLDPMRFSCLVGLDIKFFHIIVRSILDHIAQVIRYMAPKYGEIPETFDILFNRTETRSNYQKKLGSDKLKAIILSAKWYKVIREIRNNLVHWGASKVVIIEGNDIFFNIYRRTDRPEKTGFWYEYESIVGTLGTVLYHGNLVNLKLYIAYYYVKLITFLEDLGPLVVKHMGVRDGVFPIAYVFFNLSVIKRWIESLLTKIKEKNIVRKV